MIDADVMSNLKGLPLWDYVNDVLCWRVFSFIATDAPAKTGSVGVSITSPLRGAAHTLIPLPLMYGPDSG